MVNEGSDGTSKLVKIMNDTGSDAMTMFFNELQQLGSLANYTG